MTSLRASLVLLLLAGAARASEDPRPNIVFVFSDDHAQAAIGAYGGPLAALDPTPNLDALARQGMVFRRSFCTNSICGPSRAVIQTGQHSHRNGFRANGDRFDNTQPTFPKLLQQAGYRTAVIGKWHLGCDPTGFDHWEVLPGQGDYYNPVLLTAAGQQQIEGHCTDIVTDRALRWMDEVRRGDAPFLLMCQHKAPHRTWMPALRHLSLYSDVEIPEPATLFDRHEDDASPARSQEMEVDRHMNLASDLFVDGLGADGNSDGSGLRNLRSMTPGQAAAWTAAFADENAAFRAAHLAGEALVRWKLQRYLKDYLRCVRGVDESVGRILAYLDRTGLADRTVVVYSSDQGFFLGDHGWFDKRWMYEESLGMPLIVRWPGVTAPGSSDEHLVQNLDYAPTFLELAGVPVPAWMQGRSLVPLLRGEDPPDWRDAIYYHYFGHPDVHNVARHYGIRTRTEKLIRYHQLDEWEYFDLERDPDELENRYGDPSAAERIHALEARLEELRWQYADDSDVSVMPEEWRAAQRR